MANSVPVDCSVIPDALVWEILKWVPVKSLMRFKCVCKLWLSTILDPSFAGCYEGGFKGLLLTNPNRYRIVTRDFFYLNMMEGDDGDVLAHVSNHQMVNPGERMTCTDPVNGLVCFYNGNFSSIYNVATRESRVLPVSMCDSKTCIYSLGFDPSNGVYKLLKICPVYDESYAGFYPHWQHNINSEILTIGVDSIWRSIDPAPWEVRSGTYCSGGVLWWPSKLPLISRLLCFDLAHETFQSINGPEERQWSLKFVGPKATLVPNFMHLRTTSEEVTTHLFCMNDDHHGSDGQTSLSNESWSKHEFPLPKVSKLEELYDYAAVCTLPDGKLIFIGKATCHWEFPVPFYIYDPTKRELQKHFIVDCPSSSIAQQHIFNHTGYVVASYFKESIIPLSFSGSRILPE